MSLRVPPLSSRACHQRSELRQRRLVHSCCRQSELLGERPPEQDAGDRFAHAIVRRYSRRSASIGLMRDAWNAGT
jgi:hypothetical protein